MSLLPFNNEHTVALIFSKMHVKPCDTGCEQWVRDNAEELSKCFPCTLENWKLILEVGPKFLLDWENPPEELCRFVVELSPYNLKYVKNPSLELCEKTVREFPEVIYLVPDHFNRRELFMKGFNDNKLLFRPSYFSDWFS